MATAPHPFGFSTMTGGGHVSRSMMVLEMRALVGGMPLGAVVKGDFAKAIVDDNLLDKPTLASRKKSLRHLTELYGLDPTKALFRVFWSLAHVDPDALPQLCLVCAYARDPQLRESFDVIRLLPVGARIDRATMERLFEERFPGRFSTATKRSLTRNVNTTWTFGGHLAGKVKKTRRLPEPRPVSAAYAMFVGYLAGLVGGDPQTPGPAGLADPAHPRPLMPPGPAGLRGEALLDSAYAALVASSRSQLQAALSLASARGLLSLKQAAGIVEFDFSSLLTPAEQALIHESD